jgi:hypothetical protein
VSESRPARSGDGDVVVFGGSESLWISLAVLAVLALPLTIWVAVSGWQSDGPGAIVGPLVIGGIIASLLGFGARFAWRERREMIHRLDGTALLIDPQQVRDTGVLAREARQRLARVSGRG